ncbi:hypothetical protein DBR42_24200, partial [Pelomonas sp. HMWF004]
PLAATNSGTISALGNATINFDTWDNRSGLVHVEGQLTFTGRQLDNRNTLMASNVAARGIEGGQLVLAVGTVDNTGGSVLARDSLTLTSSALFNNNSGLFGSGGSLSLVDAATTGPTAQALQLRNQGGVVLANGAVDMRLRGLVSEGIWAAGGTLAINLSGDLDLTNAVLSTLSAGRQLDLTVGGSLNNQAQVDLSSGLRVQATNISNQAGAVLRSGGVTQLEASQTLTNYGLIDGQLTLVSADTVNNLDSGRIYGDTIRIQANTLNNGSTTGLLDTGHQAAVIAARERLDLGIARAFNNTEGAEALSLGALNLGGSVDLINGGVSGRVDTLLNSSSRIESGG